MENRREFLQKVSLATFGLTPLAAFLAGCNPFTDKEALTGCFEDEFHYFGNNLTNLHFYFLGARISRKKLVVCKGARPYMVVKIPQQHIAEQLFRMEDISSNPNAKVKSHIAGFSFLAFKLFPGYDPAQYPSLSLDPIDILLNWSNENLFELIIPTSDQFSRFPNDSYNPDEPDGLRNFQLQKQLQIVRDNNKDVRAFYEQTCRKLFTGKDNFPMTLLEIPHGLFVTPYTGGEKQKLKAVFSRHKLNKQQFIYSSSLGKVVRSTEEIWNAQMWFQNLEFKPGGQPAEKWHPSLRPAGYIEESCYDINGASISCPPRPECPDDKFSPSFLPTFLDKEELTYIASLGREGSDNSGHEWDIQTKGLVFTGLGSITKFQYKNYNPPRGTDLAEYEHHITLGRDEFIKVARIGVISVTGQRALYIRIGQRRIINGLSYMEFDEYVEVIQKEINYYDEALFIEKAPVPEPANFIHARRYPSNIKNAGIIHSIDNPSTDNDDPWRDTLVWALETSPGVPYLPPSELKWHTHYRRWPFKRIVSLISITPSIDTTLTEAKKQLCGTSCAEVFWPVMKKRGDDGRYADAVLSFKGFDWNENEVSFSSTFLFIPKKAIESGDNACFIKIYSIFINETFSRRHIQIGSLPIAYTPDFVPKEKNTELLPNKSNVARTDFLEYYFSICQEPTAVIKDPGLETEEKIGIREIFNERIFPLYPQIKRAQLYDENIQSAAVAPVASIIEMNEDYIRFGFHGLVPKIFPGEKDRIYNKARLIFNQSKKFMAGAETTWVNGVETSFSEGYQQVRNVFNGAGEKIGALVNPDFDVESIGLVKQGIAVGKEINEKYSQVEEFIDKFNRFNPSDLFRQAPDIFRGISLIDILQDIFPDYEAPVNEIKNVAAQINQLKEELLQHPVIQGIQTEIKRIKKLVDDAQKAIETAQSSVQQVEAELRLLKDELNTIYQFSDIGNLAEAVMELYKTPVMEALGDIVTITDNNIDNVVDFLATELLAKTETIHPYWRIFRDHNEVLQEVKKEFSSAAIKVIDDYISSYLSKEGFIIIDLTAKEAENALHSREEIIKLIKGRTGPVLGAYVSLTDAAKLEATRLLEYQKNPSENVYKVYLEAKSTVIKLKRQLDDYYKAANQKAEGIPLLINNLRKISENDRVLVDKHHEKFLRLQNDLAKAWDLTGGESNGFFALVNQVQKASKEVTVIFSKLRELKEGSGFSEQTLQTIITVLENPILKAQIAVERKRLEDFYANNYNTYRKDIHILVLHANKELEIYHHLVSGMLLTKDIWQPAGSITVKIPLLGPATLPELSNIRQTIRHTTEKLENTLKANLRQAAKNYEEQLRQYARQQSTSIVQKVKDRLTELENQVRNDPDNQTLYNQLVKAKEIFNILTSLSQKEVNFSWQNTSFKNADFGIVAFRASQHPKTTLNVNVKTTIYFEPSRFPPVISKITTKAENRLFNFSLLVFRSLTINFNEVSFLAGSDEPTRFDVKIRDMQFEGALSFVQAFEDYLKSLLGDAFRMRLGPSNVNIGYTLPIPAIQTPSFNFFNLTLNFDFWLHFQNKPMELGFSLARPDDKFGITVGIYAGFGFFAIRAEPKNGIKELEIGMEFGGYFGLSLGPMRGEVKLVVGLYYKKDSSGVVMEGYFLCEGRVKLWFLMITARFYMGVRSQGNYVEGRCTVTYEIRLGRFFKKSFEATYYKKIAGASPGNNQSASRAAAAQLHQLAAPLASFVTSNMSVAQQQTLVQNNVKRNAVPLSRDDWNSFLNSYID